jgi:hypothetical protein
VGFRKRSGSTGVDELGVSPEELIGRRDDGRLAVFGEIESRFGDAPQAALRSAVVTALVPKAALLAGMGGVSDAIGVYDRLLSLIGDVAAPEFGGAAVGVRFAKGHAAPRPRMPVLRDLLRESGSYDRIIDQAAPLPDWVTGDDE